MLIFNIRWYTCKLKLYYISFTSILPKMKYLSMYDFKYLFIIMFPSFLDALSVT